MDTTVTSQGRSENFEELKPQITTATSTNTAATLVTYDTEGLCPRHPKYLVGDQSRFGEDYLMPGFAGHDVARSQPMRG